MGYQRRVHGDLSLSNRSTMKSFLFVCLFAAASAAPAADADADPALVYGAFPHTYSYGVVPAVHSSVVKSVVSTPAKGEVKSVPPPVVYNAPAVHHPVVYNTAAVHHPVVYNAPVVSTAPVVAKAASYYANSGGAVHVVKRDADATADADADAYYSAYGYAPYGYASPYGYRFAYTYGAYRPYYGYGHYW